VVNVSWFCFMYDYTNKIFIYYRWIFYPTKLKEKKDNQQYIIINKSKKKKIYKNIIIFLFIFNY